MLLMYQLVYSPLLPGSEQSKIIRIPSGTDFKSLLKLLEEEKILANTTVFSYLSKKMNFKDGKVKSGQYKINKGNNLIQLIRKLRAGMQEPVNVVLTTAASSVTAPKTSAIPATAVITGASLVPVMFTSKV